MPALPTFPKPSAADLKNARQAFEDNEPRDLFYRAATELVGLAYASRSSELSLSEALAVLLQTWNQSFYRFRGGFKRSDLDGLDGLLNNFGARLSAYRERSIDSLVESDKEGISSLFQAFEPVLGPVGTAKALHLLAPQFFAIWDRAIAASYRLALVKGDNSTTYLRFMSICRMQCEGLASVDGRSPLKPAR